MFSNRRVVAQQLMRGDASDGGVVHQLLVRLGDVARVGIDDGDELAG